MGFNLRPCHFANKYNVVTLDDHVFFYALVTRQRALYDRDILTLGSPINICKTVNPFRGKYV